MDNSRQVLATMMSNVRLNGKVPSEKGSDRYRLAQATRINLVSRVGLASDSRETSAYNGLNTDNSWDI